MPRPEECLFLILFKNSLKQLSILTNLLPEVHLGGDEEALHQARVASRRLRSALRMFYVLYGVNKINKYRKFLRKTGEILGEAREIDVQLKFLNSIEKEINFTEKKKKISDLINHFKNFRKKAQRKIIRYYAKNDRINKAENLKYFLKMLVSKKIYINKSVGKNIKKLIFEKLKSIGLLSKYIKDGSQHKKHHLLRIEIKNLRYTLELFEKIYPEDLPDYIRLLKDLQDVLGDLHEMDVWLESLDKDKEYAFLIKKCKKMRIKYMERLNELWKRAEKQKLWKRLKKMFS